MNWGHDCSVSVGDTSKSLGQSDRVDVTRLADWTEATLFKGGGETVGDLLEGSVPYHKAEASLPMQWMPSRVREAAWHTFEVVGGSWSQQRQISQL